MEEIVVASCFNNPRLWRDRVYVLTRDYVVHSPQTLRPLLTFRPFRSFTRACSLGGRRRSALTASSCWRVAGLSAIRSRETPTVFRCSSSWYEHWSRRRPIELFLVQNCRNWFCLWFRSVQVSNTVSAEIEQSILCCLQSLTYIPWVWCRNPALCVLPRLLAN